MPKINTFGTLTLKKNAPIANAVNDLTQTGGYSMTAIARRLGIGIATLYRKKKSPEQFTIEDIRILNAMLKSKGLPMIGEGVLM